MDPEMSNAVSSFPPHQRRQLIKWNSYIMTVLFAIQFIARVSWMLLPAFFIHRYDPRGYTPSKDTPKGMEIKLFGSLIPLFANSPSLNEPPFEGFVLSCLAFTFILAVMVRGHRDDPYQPFFIIGGLFVAQIAAALYTAYYTNGSVYVLFLKSTVPLSLLGAITLSAIFHWFQRRTTQPGYETVADVENVVFKNEKTGDP